jgi:protein-L-isoaspartate(D-aspartate) O-methyltransferase
MANDTATLDQARRRLYMVNGQLRTSGVTDSAVLAAFLDTPREAFVAPSLVGLAYLDRDQLAAGAATRRLLAPRTLALLLQAAAISPGERVLDVAGGSGYSAALLARMGAKVVALESDPGAVEAARAALAGLADIEIVEGNLASGAAGKGPFDVILVNGAFETTPSGLIDQLADGGRLVGVDSRGRSTRGVIFETSAGARGERSLFDAKADVLDGFNRVANFAF